MALQLAELRALSGNLLAEQPGREEQPAEDEARLDDRPDPPLPDAIHEQPPERDDAGDDADEENRQADHAEQEQRLLPEPQLEPHREHVERANRNARNAELGPAGV